MDATRAAALRGSATFLDVREPYEFEAGHIAGSLHVPIGQVAARPGELPHEGTVVVVCQIGQRSALVTEYLRGRGVDAHNLEGGLQAWLAAGLPLEGPLIDGWARDLQGNRLQPETSDDSGRC